jgi:hypothetical protein
MKALMVLMTFAISALVSKGCTGIDNTSSQAFPVSGKALLFCESLSLIIVRSWMP